MNLYLISQTVNDDYDTYDSAVVAAENEEMARRTSPSAYYEWNDAERAWMFVYSNGAREETDFRAWAYPEHVKVELIGVTDRSAGVVLASFNAG